MIKNNWLIPLQSKMAEKREYRIYGCLEHDRAVIVFDIFEAPMGWLWGKLAVIKKYQNPQLSLLWADDLICCVSTEKPIKFSKNGKFLFFTMRSRKVKLNSLPYVVVNLDTNQFCFFRMADSIDYELEQVALTKFKLVYKHKRSLAKSRDGEIIDLDQLTWFEFQNAKSVQRKYIEHTNGE